MSFSITSFVADPAGTIVTLDWSYSNADGTLSNTHKLAMPAGSTPMQNISEATMISWLDEQLGNTAEEFDAAIANAKEQHEYASSLKQYSSTENGAYKLVEATEAN